MEKIMEIKLSELKKMIREVIEEEKSFSFSDGEDVPDAKDLEANERERERLAKKQEREAAKKPKTIKEQGPPVTAGEIKPSGPSSWRNNEKKALRVIKLAIDDFNELQFGVYWQMNGHTLAAIEPDSKRIIARFNVDAAEE